MVGDIFLDARRAAWNPSSGTGIYARRITEELPVVAPDLRFRVLSRSLAYDGRERAGWRRLPGWPRKLASDIVEVPTAARGSALTHLLYPEALVPGPIVVTIHDLTVFDRQMRLGRSFEYYRWMHEHSARKALRVICPSIATARRVEQVLERDDVCVVSNGVDVVGPRTSADGDESPPFVLYFGGFAKWKNVSILREAWGNLGEVAELPLVVVGRPPEDLLLPPGSHLVGVVDRDKLWDLIRRCAAIVYPSVSEGFGFPIIEGLLMGKPVVCGPVGVVPELVVDSVRLVDVHSPSSVASGIASAVHGWRPSASAVEWARKKFTWSQCASETAEIYRSCF